MVLYFQKKSTDSALSRQSNIYEDYISGIPVTKLAEKIKFSMSRIDELLNIEKNHGYLHLKIEPMVIDILPQPIARGLIADLTRGI